MKKKISKQKLLNIILKVLVIGIVLVVGNNTVFATNDPLAVINNLKGFMYQIIGAIGAILLLWGIVQIGMAIKSHDPSQRANGFMTLAGGVIIAFAKQILELILG
ncbi:MAG: glutamyl-tRNA amidotransferase [Clostridium sp.]|nr:glutamyl-tRNA amidotransferase [Clostridium sp.]MEE0768412.1 glutamyl-tRNA amidotransferase [Clostridia bacterium]